MTKQSSQAGFGAIEVLLALILVAIVGFTGYYIYNANNKATDSYDAAGDSSATIMPKDKNTSNTTENQYLTVKEWGIKIPENDSNDLTYAFVPASKTLAANTMLGLSTQSLAAADNECSAVSGAAGGITRYKASDQFSDDGTTAAQAATAKTMPFAKIGTYYYFYQAPQGTCATDGNKTADQLMTAAVAELKALVPQAEAVN